MRSRYTAFVVADAAYLLRTWDPRTAPPRIHFDPEQRWLGLRILGSTAGGLLDATGTVSFRATYRLGTSTDLGASTDAIRENSQFRRHDGRWVYVGPAG